MTSRYKLFNRKRLSLESVFQRESKSGIEIMIDPASNPPKITKKQRVQIESIADRIIDSRRKGNPVIMAYGAHVFKNGCSPIVIELMKKGYLQHLLTNGAGVIHDFEMAFVGRTEEDVRKYLSQGQFGLWQETGEMMNAQIAFSSDFGCGLGESIGQAISCGKYKNRDMSIVGRAYEFGIPLTCHIGIGYDIIHEHPSANGAKLGKASYTDFLIFANSVSKLKGGVFLSVGSAIMAPMVFEKALSMARNVAMQDGETIDNFSIVVNDIQPGEWDSGRGEPSKDNPAYYHRFCKTFSRATDDLRYVRMDNRAFLHNLYRSIEARERGGK